MSEPYSWLQVHANWPGVHDFFSDIAGPVGWWVVLQLAVLLVGTRRGLRLAWLVCIAAYTNTLLKWAWAAPRPYWVSDVVEATRATAGFGMPSGHAQGATSLWVGLSLLVTKGPSRWTFVVLAIVFIVGTGVSRVFYGVHSLGQVLVGTAIGVLLSLALWRLLPMIESRLRALTLRGRCLCAVAGLSVGAALGGLVFWFRRDFVAPADWQQRFEATQIRTGGSGDMGLVHGSSMVLLALIAGYALLALVTSELGHRLARRWSTRIYVVLLAVVINGVLLAALRGLDGAIEWVAVAFVVHPVLALWLPLRLLGEPDTSLTASGGRVDG